MSGWIGLRLNPDFQNKLLQNSGLFVIIARIQEDLKEGLAEDILINLSYRSKLPGLGLRLQLLDQKRALILFTESKQTINELILDSRQVERFIFPDWIRSKRELTVSELIQRQQQYWHFYQQLSLIQARLKVEDDGNDYHIQIAAGIRYNFLGTQLEKTTFVFSVEKRLGCFYDTAKTHHFKVSNQVTDFVLRLTIIPTESNDHL